jgi:ribonuclease HIII
VVAQGKGTEEFVKFLLEPEVLGTAELGYEEERNPEFFEPHIGVDESGKGDFFGPLVIAGAYIDTDVARQLNELGVMDSKRISSDAKIAKIAASLRKLRGLAFEVIQINPTRYNELYSKFGNLNRLLAWGHAKVIENLLERVPDCPRAVSDQFANPAVLRRALQEKAQSIELVQRTKAESDPAVAAASILARDAFVQWMKKTGLEQGFEDGLPKGASAAVKKAAARIAGTGGSQGLAQVAKMHFKTAAEVLNANDAR